MVMSFFRSRSQKPSEAYQPLVTSLPTRRRKPAAAASGDAAGLAGDEATAPFEDEAGTTVISGNEDDVMRTIFAEMNAVAPPPEVSASPETCADATETASSPATEIPVTESPAAESPIADPAVTDLEVTVPEVTVPALTLPEVTVADDDALRALFVETLGDALAPEPHEAALPAPAELALPVAPPSETLTDGGFADHSDEVVIGMLHEAQAALADLAPVTIETAPRRWPWQRRTRRPKPVAPQAVTPKAVATTAVRPLDAAAPADRPARPARLPRKPIRIPGTRAQRWLLGSLATALALVGLGAVAGGFAALVSTLLVGLLAILSRDIARCIPGQAEMPLPPGVLRLAPAATVLVLGLGLAALALPLVSGFVTWTLTLVALSVWLAQGPARIARDAAAARDRKRRRAAQAIFALLLLPHRPATERLLHRRLAATPDDPLTAEAGESYYDFAARAIPDALRDAFAMERQVMTPRLGSPRGGVSPLLVTAMASLVWLGLATAVFGPLALSVLVALMLGVEAQLLMSDYLSSYGLQRRRLAHDKVEPLGPNHRWAAPPAFGDIAAQLTGTRTTRPGQDGAPVLPRSAAGMALRALVPPLWHGDLDARVMTMTKASLRGEPAPLG